MSKGINIGAEGPTTESVTIENADGMKTANVQENGNVYVGRDVGGEDVLLVWRIEQNDEQENDESDAEDTDN